MKLFRRHKSRGQALVEFALIVPIFLLVMLGLFDLGRAVFYHSTISNASRQAVRLGIVDQNLTAIRQAAVDNASGVMPISTGDVTVTFLAPDLSVTGTCPAEKEIGCIVRVRVDHAFVPATPFAPQLSLSATTNQPIERSHTSP